MVKTRQYCQNRSVNIMTRVCRELTRLSRSKHTLVKILTIGQFRPGQFSTHPNQYIDYRVAGLSCPEEALSK